MANMNIFGKDWMDMIFKGRNKEYGAYELRKKSTRHTFLAMILGFLFIGLAFGSKYAYDQFGDLIAKQKDNDGGIEVIEIVTPPPIEETEPEIEEIIEEPEPEPVEPEGASKNVIDEKELKDITVKKDDEVKNELKTSQDDFDDNTTSGQKDQKGDTEDGDLKNDGSNTGEASKGSKGNDRSDTFTEEPDNKIYHRTSHKAEPKNGMNSFFSEFKRKFRNLDMPSNVKTVTIKLKFVVEKDGSLTDIEALDNKYGVGDEAIRVLKSMPNWKPAQHNGKTVRSSFRLPIKMQVN